MVLSRTEGRSYNGRASNIVQFFSTEDFCKVEVPVLVRDTLTEYHQIVRVDGHRHAVVK